MPAKSIHICDEINPTWVTYVGMCIKTSFEPSKTSNSREGFAYMPRLVDISCRRYSREENFFARGTVKEETLP